MTVQKEALRRIDHHHSVITGTFPSSHLQGVTHSLGARGRQPLTPLPKAEAGGLLQLPSQPGQQHESMCQSNTTILGGKKDMGEGWGASRKGVSWGSAR